MHKTNDKTAWIIDGAYLFNFGFRVDILKLRSAIIDCLKCERFSEGHFVSANGDEVSDSQYAFYQWLRLAAPSGPQLQVRLFALKELVCHCPDGVDIVRKIQKGVDVAIATKMITLAVQPDIQQIVLVAGDGDFEDAISYIRNVLRKDVVLVGSKQNMSPNIQCYASRVLFVEDMFDQIIKL